MVDRFDGSPEMQSYKNGDYVRYSDYAALEARAEAAERALAERAGGVKVKALEWYEAKALGGGRKSVAQDCFGNEFARIDLTYHTAIEVEEFKAERERDYERRILSALTTEPSAPEGRQEAVRIGDAVLDWMVKFDLLDAGNEYYVSDVLAVLNDLTPSTRPSEQAVTEEWREIKQQVQPRIADGYTAVAISKPGYWLVKGPGPAAALKTAMEAGR